MKIRFIHTTLYRMYRLFFIQVIAFSIVAICILPSSAYAESTPDTVATEEATSTEGTAVEFPNMKLNVPIPGLELASNLKVESGYLSIPFLAQYIAAIYKYLIGISIIIASIMIVYAGFLYVISPIGADIKHAKTIIVDSVIGVVLLLGIQTLTNFLSPENFNLKPLQVLYIEPKTFELMRTLGTTRVDTQGDESHGGGTAPVSSQKATEAQFGSCPLSDLPPAEAGKDFTIEPRFQDFSKKIQPLISGKSFQDKVSTIADAAVQCGIHMGCCGCGSGAIWALAGVGNPSCLTTKDRMSCMLGGKPAATGSRYFQLVPIPGAQIDRYRYLNRIAAAIRDGIADCKTQQVACQNAAATQADKAKCIKDFSNCPNKARTAAMGTPADRQAAGAEALAKARAEFKGGPEYDEAIKSLNKGDIIFLYAGNHEVGGEHSVMYLGDWPDGTAKVVQGAWSKNVNTNAHYCIKSACGAKIWPVTHIFKPILQ